MAANLKNVLLDLIEAIPVIGKPLSNLARRRGKWKSKLSALLLLTVVAIGCLIYFNRPKPVEVPASAITNSGNNNNNSVVVVGTGNSVRVENPTNAAAVKVPAIPAIYFELVGGLPASITTNREYLRMHNLVVRNFDDVELLNFCSRLQFPEPIENFPMAKIEKTIGVEVGWRSLGVELSVNGTGGRSDTGMWVGPSSAVHFVYPHPCYIAADERSWGAEHSGNGKLTGVWELTINKIPPRGLVSIQFFTSNAPDATNYIRFINTPNWQREPKTTPKTNEINLFFEGEFQYVSGNKFDRRQFFVPITYDANGRTVSSLSPQPNTAGWRPVTLDLY